LSENDRVTDFGEASHFQNYGFSDADVDDGFGGWQIAALPTAGAGMLYLAGSVTGALSPVHVGDVITADALPRLTLVPTNQAHDYDITFSIKVMVQHGGTAASTRL